MEQFLTILFSGLGGLGAAVIPAYLAFRKQKDNHAEEMAKIQAEAEAKLKSAEDARQNEAFDRLKESFNTLKQMFDDLLTRTQKLEADHNDCQKLTSALKDEIATLKKG